MITKDLLIRIFEKGFIYTNNQLNYGRPTISSYFQGYVIPLFVLAIIYAIFAYISIGQINGALYKKGKHMMYLCMLITLISIILYGIISTTIIFILITLLLFFIPGISIMDKYSINKRYGVVEEALYDQKIVNQREDELASYTCDKGNEEDEDEEEEEPRTRLTDVLGVSELFNAIEHPLYIDETDSDYEVPYGFVLNGQEYDYTDATKTHLECDNGDTYTKIGGRFVKD